MKKLILAALLSLASVASAQTTITLTSFDNPADFTPQLTWDGNVTVANSILAVTGGDATGTVYGDISSLNITSGAAFLSLTVTASVDTGNAATSFTVNLFDNQLNGVLSASFNTNVFSSGFTTATSTLALYQGAVTAAVPIAYMQIAGNGTTAAFRMSFNEVVANAIPEPSTYAAIAGALMLGYVAYRRRQAAALAA
jgi:hypothetical protein